MASNVTAKPVDYRTGVLELQKEYGINFLNNPIAKAKHDALKAQASH